jgi:hypothetical protein
MSVYHYFVCKKCNKISEGNFARMAWGWGNVDIIDCFQFIMKHSDLCGHKNIEIFSEHEIDAHEVYGRLSYENLPYDKDQKTLHQYFPCAYDWDKDEWSKRFKEHQEAKKAEDYVEKDEK